MILFLQFYNCMTFYIIVILKCVIPCHVILDKDIIIRVNSIILIVRVCCVHGHICDVILSKLITVVLNE